MAYFECVIGSAASGGSGADLVVTCASSFAGATITCTDGNDTFTQTCPSTSPYIVTFENITKGTWTISGTISGTTYSESIVVDDFEIELVNNIDISVDVYSAANDTVSYIGIDNQIHTITTDSNGHASTTITISANGENITFTSSVAKSLDNLSNDYTKTIALTSETSSIKVMPDNTLYWWGYNNGIEECSINNGWSVTGTSFVSPTFGTNKISVNSSSTAYRCGIGSSSEITMTKINAIVQGITIRNGNYGDISTTGDKQINGTGSVYNSITNSVIDKITLTNANNNSYANINCVYRAVDVFAMWYE